MSVREDVKLLNKAKDFNSGYIDFLFDNILSISKCLIMEIFPFLGASPQKFVYIDKIFISLQVIKSNLSFWFIYEHHY